MNRWQLFKHNFVQLLISCDQVLRCCIGLIVGLINGKSESYADETLSAWAYRKSDSYWYAYLVEKIINIIMFPFEGFKWNHCKRAFESESKRKHSPC